MVGGASSGRPDPDDPLVLFQLYFLHCAVKLTQIHCLSREENPVLSVSKLEADEGSSVGLRRGPVHDPYESDCLWILDRNLFALRRCEILRFRCVTGPVTELKIKVPLRHVV